MAAKQIIMSIIKQILRFKQKGEAILRIADNVGVSRNTQQFREVAYIADIQRLTQFSFLVNLSKKRGAEAPQKDLKSLIPSGFNVACIK